MVMEYADRKEDTQHFLKSLLQPFMIEVTRRFAIDKSDIRPQSIFEQIMDYMDNTARIPTLKSDIKLILLYALHELIKRRIGIFFLPDGSHLGWERTVLQRNKQQIDSCRSAWQEILGNDGDSLAQRHKPIRDVSTHQSK